MSHQEVSSRAHNFVHAARKTHGVAREQAELRSNLYGFFAAHFLCPPDEDFVQHLLDQAFLHELSSLFGPQAVAQLREFTASVRPGEDVADLRQEYMDLFVVPSSRYVTPFEDVYRGRPADGEAGMGRLMGELSIALRRRYREAGAEMVRACKQLPNHIGVELSFMSFLCNKEAAAIENEGYASLDPGERKAADSVKYRELQIRFLQEHLNEWFPQLSRAIQARTKSSFYQGLALITEEFLVLDTASVLARSYARE
ncbi:MAG TPA: molecular chaperone TorD family protein, partial [Acidobacteriota bacterium]|nr:molecular chaperone TorD family protein [Acidobacteriota bacterium]